MRSGWSSSGSIHWARRPRSTRGRTLADLGALWPVGVLWVGLLVVIATPIIRVAAAAVSFARGGEWRMVLIALAILVVIATGVLTALASEV